MLTCGIISFIICDDRCIQTGNKQIFWKGTLEMEVLQLILFIVYIAAGWWAANRTVYANRVIFGQYSTIMMQKFIVVLLFGWALIPIALIKTFLLGR